MRGINKVILIGNLGDDPDYRESPNGTAMMRFSVATNETYRNRNTNETETKTEWHRVVVFGKLAQAIHSYLKKGSSIYVEGKLRTSKYQDRDGNDRYSTDVIVDFNGTIQMLDRREEFSNYSSNNSKHTNTGNANNLSNNNTNTNTNTNNNNDTGMQESKDFNQDSFKNTPTNNQDNDDDIPF